MEKITIKRDIEIKRLSKCINSDICFKFVRYEFLVADSAFLSVVCRKWIKIVADMATEVVNYRRIGYFLVRMVSVEWFYKVIVKWMIDNIFIEQVDSLSVQR